MPDHFPPVPPAPFIPADARPAYFISDRRGGAVRLLDQRTTHFIVGQKTFVSATDYIACHIYFRHQNNRELYQLCLFQEN